MELLQRDSLHNGKRVLHTSKFTQCTASSPPSELTIPLPRDLLILRPSLSLTSPWQNTSLKGTLPVILRDNMIILHTQNGMLCIVSNLGRLDKNKRPNSSHVPASLKDRGREKLLKVYRFLCLWPPKSREPNSCQFVGRGT